MDETVTAVIDDVVARAAAHDADEPDRLRRWRVLEPDAGRLLWFLVQSSGARDVVEIGTSHGVSTLWLADAVRSTGGHLSSVDADPDVQDAALANLVRAGLDAHVTFGTGDGGAALAGLDEQSVDLLFLDAERTEYPGWWPHPVRVLRPGGVLVVDNAFSHADEVAPLAALIDEHPGLTSTTVAVGKGELLALRSR
ncbi:putative O-methyltransferase YrrM [Pseudonocardia sediminis]|uniref:Putative O-methyltransferase YrrM n=1 Tax=Pseudonocardia sediminis TaxID=1397368 RepID=A0A4Q7UXI5_PSEST|nr:class I SAM-dependent methyltransferase [Pseudonocardia sediminis]RZT86606.1 putative O-methyltransferase YrrM [Pseudonocardia sediminis]